MVISRSVAGILLVLKYGTTSYEDLKEAKRRTELSNSNIIGCVLNGIKRSGGKHNYKYKYKYKSYYSYGSDGSHSHSHHSHSHDQRNDIEDDETSHSIDD
jgi:Mrp family chromosome partitioning ATPase